MSSSSDASSAVSSVMQRRRARSGVRRSDRPATGRKSRPVDAVTELVETAQCGNRGLEDATAALGVRKSRGKRRQRRHDFHTMVSKEVRKIEVVGQLRNCQIAPVHDMTSGRAGSPNDVAKGRVHLRRTACDVERGNVAGVEKAQTGVDYVRRHDFAAIRARIDMAVAACLITALAEVDLEGADCCGSKGIVPAPGNRIFERARRVDLGERGALGRRVRQRVMAVRKGHEHLFHIASLSTWPRICTPWTSDAPPRIAAAT